MTDLNKPCVSIIIPCYNDKFIQNTLEAIREQSFENYEVLLIDDGSTDLTKNICTSVCKIDSRFKYFFQRNQGPSKARNYALSLAQGKYICFLDSDDIIHKHYLSLMITSQICTGADIVFCDYDVGSVINDSSFICDKVDQLMSVDSFYKYIFGLKTNKLYGANGGFLWNKLFTKDLIEGIKIPDTSIAEDEQFLFKVCKKVNGVSFLAEKLYFYKQRVGQITHNEIFRFGFPSSRLQLYAWANTKIEKDIVVAAYAQAVVGLVISIFLGRVSPSKDQLILTRSYVTKLIHLKRMHPAMVVLLEDKYRRYYHLIYLFLLPISILSLLLKTNFLSAVKRVKNF